MRERRPETLTVLAGLLGFALGLRPVAVLAQEPDYVQLVELYAQGEQPAAVAALRGRNQLEMEQQQKKVAEAWRKLDSAWLRAAVMLHSDADEAERPSWVGVELWYPCSGPHARRAGQYAGFLARRADGRDFARRFFLAMTQRCHWEGPLDDAERWGLEGLELFPGDAGLLLAVGSIHEQAATIGYRSFTTQAAENRLRERDFKEARRCFSEAVAADPGLTLARLRLGRVLWRLGESEAARSRLEETLGSTQDPALLYLAHLFLGQVHEDANRLQPAVTQYQLALDAHPGAQAAAVALSHALRLGGDAARSRGVLSGALAEAGRRGGGREDVYWNYLSWPAIHRDQLFARLREEALR